MTDLNRVNISVNSVEDLNLDNFVDDKNHNKFLNATVELNGKHYKVTAFNNGKIDVVRDRQSFGSKLKGLFQHHASHTTTATAIRDRVLSLVSKVAVHNHTLSNLNKLFVQQYGQNAENKTLEVAHYGFSPNREKAVITEREFNSNDANYEKGNKIHLNTIDSYNTCLGITWVGVQANTIHLYLNDIKNGTLDAAQPAAPLHSTDSEGKTIETADKKLSKERLEAWKDHLQENASKLDIIGKLSKYMTSNKKVGDIQKKSGWEYEFAKNPDKALKKFIQKNIPLTDKPTKGDLKRLTNLFKEYIRVYNQADGEERTKNLEKFMKDNFRQGNAVRGMDDDLYYPHDIQRGCGTDEDESPVSKLEDLFNDVLRTAFFRQTSKMGLDFFRKRNVPILFQWADYRGVSLDKTKFGNGIGNIQNKWWLGNPSKFADGQKGESITYSEARHLKKIAKAEKAGEIPTQLKAKLSTGIDKN